MDLVAYLDEAGTHAGTRLTAMAGWIADVDRWKRFDVEWTSLLARNGISHVHGTDLMSGKGPFKGWAISLIPRLIDRAGLAGCSCLKIVIEDGHQNVGAAPEIFGAFNELADEPIRSLLRKVVVEQKRASFGLQAADMLAYPAWRGETDGTLVYQDLDLLADASPLSLPDDAPFRVPIKPETLTDLRTGTLALPAYRRHARRNPGAG